MIIIVVVPEASISDFEFQTGVASARHIGVYLTPAFRESRASKLSRALISIFQTHRQTNIFIYLYNYLCTRNTFAPKQKFREFRKNGCIRAERAGSMVIDEFRKCVRKCLRFYVHCLRPDVLIHWPDWV